MPSAEAKCPECGLRVCVSEREHRLIDPRQDASTQMGGRTVLTFNPFFPKRARSCAISRPSDPADQILQAAAPGDRPTWPNPVEFTSDHGH